MDEIYTSLTTGPIKRDLRQVMTDIFSVKQACVLEGIWDHSWWLIFGMGLQYAHRFGTPSFEVLFGWMLMQLDKTLLGNNNPIHQGEALTKLYHKDIWVRYTPSSIQGLIKQVQNDKRSEAFWEQCMGIPSSDYMQRFNDLKNERWFPPFSKLPPSEANCDPKLLPDGIPPEAVPDSTALQSRRDVRNLFFPTGPNPKRAWCLLATVLFIDKVKGRWLLRDRNGESFAAEFPQFDGYEDVNVTGRIAIAIPYAEQCTLSDGKIGIKDIHLVRPQYVRVGRLDVSSSSHFRANQAGPGSLTRSRSSTRTWSS